MVESFDSIGNKLIDQALNPAIYLLSALAFVWFLYGVVMFILARVNGEEEGIKKGKQHMLWGLIGLAIMFSAGSIYKIITSFFE
ncbi:MAG: hypothetical protein QG630_432 [Patescibacteria group bacterium]|nr:hypothetical protein [Patescibacteria group bacterium]